MISSLDLPSSSKETKNLVVMLHGYGSDGHDLLAMAPILQKSLPYTHFYSPNGIEAFEGAMYGYQWFSLANRDFQVISKKLEGCYPNVKKLLDNKLSELSLSYKDLILIGFSQGSMLAIYFTLETKGILCTAAFSGRSFLPKEIKNYNTPICLIHGKQDEIVPYANMEQSVDMFSSLAIPHSVLGLDNLGHTIDSRGLNFAKEFILKNIPV